MVQYLVIAIALTCITGLTPAQENYMPFIKQMHINDTLVYSATFNVNRNIFTEKIVVYSAETGLLLAEFYKDSSLVDVFILSDKQKKVLAEFEKSLYRQNLESNEGGYIRFIANYNVKFNHVTLNLCCSDRFFSFLKALR